MKTSAGDEALSILRAIQAHPHIDLDDLVYQVREREGLGWEGPQVKAWSDIVTCIREIAS
jgi:hypothetical protein